MNKPAHPHRWFSAWRASARPAADEDPADYGTAFGLELSLPDPHAEAPTPAVVRRPPGWVQRLTARRKPAV